MKFYQEWEGRNSTKAPDEWFKATVPGNIQYDYGIYKKFEDVSYSDNYKQYLPLENDIWEYRTNLNYSVNEGERVFFVSGGIDYRYDIYLGDEKIYEYEGMFKPVDIDLTDKICSNGNVLRVVIYPHPKRIGAPSGTRDEADFSAKPPVCYGWDWNPRLLISGIWQETYIETRDEYFIGKSEAIATLSEDFKTGTVNFIFDSSKECTVHLFDENGNEIYCGSEKSITVQSPNLWWCNGHGLPYLYRWVIKNEKESREGYIGFKKLRLVRNANSNGPTTFPKGRYEAPITIELNGKRIFAKGSNWVNPELFWGQITKERYEELVLLAKDANMNIFRMWGGAGIAKNDFYDVCDKNGILIWQEFMLACNDYPDDEHYLSVLESEATSIIKQLRSHACLALWCGGNELFNNWSGMTDQSLPLRLLNKLCYDYDDGRPFLATSPLYGMAHGGYTFYAYDQNGEVFSQFQKASNTAYTEFGVPGLADVETLKSIIPADELFPPRITDSWVAHHGFYAWGESRWLCLDVMNRYFQSPSSIEELVSNSNYLQCEGYRGAFEEARKQWPRCSMAINWCFNEPWNTVGNNNLITYPNRPKPAYYYVKQALRPTLFSARIPKFVWKENETFEAEIWLINDSEKTEERSVSVYVHIGESEYHLLDWKASAKSCENAQGPTVRMVLPHVENAERIKIELRSDDDVSSTYEFIYKKAKTTSAVKQLNV